MSDITAYGQNPGTGALVSTGQTAIWNGRETSQEFSTLVAVSTTVDATNTPTTYLRAGLVLGKITSTGKLIQYSPTATDGSETAYCVLNNEISTLDQTGTAADKEVNVLLKGILQAANLIGLDNVARAQLVNSGRYIFDDELKGKAAFLGRPVREINKAADYTVVASDDGTLFTASAAANFTLPALAAGLSFEFLNLADSNMGVVSAEGDNIVWDNDASCDSLTFFTSSHKIGGHLQFYCNAAATKWYVRQLGPSTCTVTAAT